MFGYIIGNRGCLTTIFLSLQNVTRPKIGCWPINVNNINITKKERSLATINGWIWSKVVTLPWTDLNQGAFSCTNHFWMHGYCYFLFVLIIIYLLFRKQINYYIYITYQLSKTWWVCANRVNPIKYKFVLLLLLLHHEFGETWWIVENFLHSNTVHS